jgi:hypothetical protein
MMEMHGGRIAALRVRFDWLLRKKNEKRRLLHGQSLGRRFIRLEVRIDAFSLFFIFSTILRLHSFFDRLLSRTI